MPSVTQHPLPVVSGSAVPGIISTDDSETNDTSTSNTTASGNTSSHVASTRDLLVRESQIQECELGTPFWVLLNPTSDDSSKDIDNLLHSTLSSLNQYINDTSAATIPDNGNPIQEYSAPSGDRIDVGNAQGQQLNWRQLALAINLTIEWMEENKYCSIAVTIRNGSTTIGTMGIS